MPESIRLACAALLLALAGCSAGVAPWQRGWLAEPAMQLDTQQLDAQQERQYYTSREAARGGHGFGGTGCGCN